MIQTCTSSTEQALAKIGDLMGLLGATASSSGMDLALQDATVWAERHIGNSASYVARRQVYQETLAGSGSQQLMVSRVPLWRIQRLFDATDTCEATEYCSTDYRIEDVDAGFITRTGDAGFVWDSVQQWDISSYPSPGQVRRRWLAVYEAGWQLNEMTTSQMGVEYVTTTTYRTLPSDVERAVLFKAADLYQGAASGSVRSMSVGPLSLNFGSEAIDPVVHLLAPYRRL